MEELREQMLAEQAERIARLQMRNEIRMAGLVIWGVLLLGWLIVWFIKLMRDIRRSEAMCSGEISFTCETCGHSFCVPSDYLVRHPFMFRKSVYKGNGMTGRTVRQSGRLFCPSCQKKTWCRQDMEESARIGMSGFGEALRKDGLRFLAGAAVLLAAGGIFFTVLNIVF